MVKFGIIHLLTMRLLKS